MQKEDPNSVQNNACDVNSKNKFRFEFEQFSWTDLPNLKCDMAKNAFDKIEEERKNIERDLKILNAVEQEKLRETNLLVSLLETKAKLMEKINQPTNLLK